MTPDESLKLAIGHYVVENAFLRARVEQVTAELEQMVARLAAIESAKAPTCSHGTEPGRRCGDCLARLRDEDDGA